jgi:hypothetical protein
VLDQRSEHDDMLQLLRERFAQDSDEQILPRLTRWLADPLKPVNEAGYFRPSPLVLVVLVVGLIAVGAFLYFGYWAQ